MPEEKQERGAYSKRWCFTINNPTDGNLDYFKSLSANELISGCVAGLEQGETGTVHVQGYAEFTKRMRRITIINALPEFARAHLEVAHGTPVQAAEYCRKEGKVLADFGIRDRKLGVSEALISARDFIRTGVPFEELYEEHFPVAIRYERALRSYSNFVQGTNELRLDRTVHVYWGATGLGKTRAAYEANGDGEVYWHTGTEWFDGYRGQHSVIFDDFDGAIQWAMFLRLLDIYPMQVPVKGGFVWWRPKRIFITSNKHPSDWYRSHQLGSSYDVGVNPILRRITEIKEFK